MENNKLYKSTSFKKLNGYISNSPALLSQKFNINSSTYINNKNLKINLNDETYRKFSKLSKFNKSLSSTNYNFYKFNNGQGFHGNILFTKRESRKIKKELSVSLFQNNDVELVRNLNPDSEKDLCSNLLLKEKLKNKIESNLNISLLFNPNSKIRSEEKRYALPKLSYLSVETILEKNKNIKNLKKELQENKQTSLLEKDLNKKLKQINEIKSLKKQNKIKIYDNFKKLLKEIDNIGYDIQFLNHQLNEKNSQIRRASYFDKKKGRRRSSIKLESLNNNNIQDKDNEKIDLDNFNLPNNNGKFNKLSLMQSLYKDQKNKDFEKKMKQDKIGELKKELKQLKSPLKSINNEINELKHVEKNIKQRLMKHYQELLYKGKEIRNEGLSWIIKAIWRLGENVPMSFMPTFLDFNGIKYLFNMARLSVELDAKKKFLSELKLKLKMKLINSHKKKEKDNELKNNNESTNNSKSSDECLENSKKKKKFPFSFKTNLLFQNKKLNHSSSQPEFMKSFYLLNEKFKKILGDKILDDENEELFRGTAKEISKICEDNENSFNIINSPAVTKIKNLEKKIKEIEIEIKNLKKFEIQRIFKEFIDYDYENKYHASIDVVLGALIGENSKNIQVNKFNVFRKGYFDEIKNIRFYEYAKRNGWVS